MVQLARKVLKNSFFNTSRAFISGIGGLFFSVILARLLMPELFGIYALAIAVCFFTLQLDPGTGYATIRYVSYALGRNNESLARGYFRFLLKVRLILGFAFSLSLAILAKPLAFRVFDKPELFIPLEVLSVFIFLFFLTDLLDCCFEAFQNFKYPAVRHAIYEFAKFGLVIPFVITGFFYGIFIGLTIAAFVTFIVMFSALRRKYGVLFRGEVAEIEKRRVIRFLGFMSIGSFSGVIFSYVDIIMLGIFLPAEYAGYYKAGTTIIFGIAGLTAISGVLFPVFTQLEGESLEDAFKKVFKYSSILSFPFAVSLAYFSGQIISVVYGVEYLPAALTLLILSPIIIFNSTNFFGNLFGAKEKPEYSTAVSIISMSLNVVLNYFLILRFGMIGAAIATTISRFLDIISIGVLSSTILKIRPNADSIYKPLFASLTMFAFLHLSPHPTTLFIGVTELCVAMAVYFGVLFLTGGMGREDFRYAKTILGIESFSSLLKRNKR
jgi:O-antigen/teichoic acid export membrane protein